MKTKTKPTTNKNKKPKPNQTKKKKKKKENKKTTTKTPDMLSAFTLSEGKQVDYSKDRSCLLSLSAERATILSAFAMGFLSTRPSNN